MNNVKQGTKTTGPAEKMFDTANCVVRTEEYIPGNSLSNTNEVHLPELVNNNNNTNGVAAQKPIAT